MTKKGTKPNGSAVASHTSASADSEPGALDTNQLEKSVYAIVDSRTCFRDALANALRRLGGYSDRQCIADYPDAESLLADVHLQRRGRLVVLMGTSLFDEHVDADVDILSEQLQGSAVALLVDSLSPESIDLWFRKKPSALIPSAYSATQLAACLELISTGTSFLPTEYLDEIVKHTPSRASSCDIEATDSHNLLRIASMLTPRQREVMRYVAMGRSNKYIASELDVCESTIKVHVSELLRRLGATSRTHAAWLFSKLPTEAEL